MKRLRVPFVVVLLVVAGRASLAEADTVTNLYSFAGPPDGAGPQASLTEGFDGDFYGTTRNGGTTNEGTVFRISSGGSYDRLYSFGVLPNDGTTPHLLMQGSDTNFYGTAYEGGAKNDGAIFRISPDGAYTNLYSFAGYPSDGANPRGQLAEDDEGNFYGTAEYGGASTDGIVFRISPSGLETNLYSFAGFPKDGALPLGGLVRGSDGNFYGTTFDGGISTVGTVFRISPEGNYTNLYSFGNSPNDGQYPEAGLMLASDGNFYGTTTAGGTSSNGTVFRISPEGDYVALYSFAGPYAHPADGATPDAELVEGADTNLYGTTSYGGTHGYGTVFQISLNGRETNLHSFAGSSATPPDGQYPQSGLVQGRDGRFYGTTFNGGANNQGAVFMLDISQSGGTVENCTFTLSATNLALTDLGGARSVKVKAQGTNCLWAAMSNDPFITITGDSSGTGQGMVHYTVAANTNAVARVGTMTIAGQTFTIEEAAAPCEFMLGETEAGFSSQGGSSNVTVTANGTTCSWKALVSGSFIKINSGGSGAGDGTVHYTVEANAKRASRKGTITLGKDKLTIVQAGAP